MALQRFADRKRSADGKFRCIIRHCSKTFEQKDLLKTHLINDHGMQMMHHAKIIHNLKK